MSDFIAKFLAGVIFTFLFIIVCLGFQMIGYTINTGDGKYSGQIVEVRHHGIVFKTYGLHLKTGENSSNFEDFCILDKSIYEQAQSIPSTQKVIVSYKKKFASPSWKCDGQDSNDIVTKIEVMK